MISIRIPQNYGSNPIIKKLLTYTIPGIDTLALFVPVFLLLLLPASVTTAVNSKTIGSEKLLLWNMIIKLCQIPAYIIIFVIGLFLAISVYGIFYAAAFAVTDFLIMTASSVYGISGLYEAYKNGSITKKSAIISGICHFLFAADVIAAIWSFSKVIRKTKKEGIKNYESTDNQRSES